jgi:hypothetical protein
VVNNGESINAETPNEVVVGAVERSFSVAMKYRVYTMALSLWNQPRMDAAAGQPEMCIPMVVMLTLCLRWGWVFLDEVEAKAAGGRLLNPGGGDETRQRGPQQQHLSHCRDWQVRKAQRTR